MATRLSQRQGLCRIQITVPLAVEDAASALLETFFEQWPSSFSRPGATQAELSVFLRPDQAPSPSQLAQLNARLLALLPPPLRDGPAEVRLTHLADQDWRHAWKQHFKPMEIGSRLLLRPSWSRRRARSGQVVVVLDPGLSFGTGQHPTTSFCLRQVVSARRKGEAQSLLDIGTGSGILAIAAAKLGYDPVQGFDHDPGSVRVAGANARRNRVQGKICFRQADLCDLPAGSRRRYDVVCANLLADLLTRESSSILHFVKPGGLLVLAGILGAEFPAVDQHYRSLGAQLLRTRLEGDWQSGAYRIIA